MNDADLFAADPDVRMAALRALRDACPVAALSQDGPFVAVGHEAVASAFRRVEDFGGSAAQDGLPEDDKNIAGILEPRHAQIRRIINSVVAFHKSQHIEPYLEELCSELVQGLADASRSAGPQGFDVMPLFADPIPPRAMARLLGFPAEDAARYYPWADELGERFAAAVAAGVPLSMADAVPEFASYVEDRIDQRLAEPADDWPNDALSRFLTTDIEGLRLSRRSICIQIMFMIGAGSETTRNLLGSILYRLAGQPELYERVRTDPTRVDLLVEEGLRIDAPAQFIVRRCLHGAELGGTEISRGARVMLAISAANHDPAVFEEPTRFDIDRRNRDHLSFGFGSHICPGASLARLEARTALRAFVSRVASVRLADGYAFDHATTGMLHGPKTLRLVLDIEDDAKISTG
jgi:cytochrome P450